MIRPREISNRDDVVDSRDVIARLRELEEWREEAIEEAKRIRAEGSEELISNLWLDDIDGVTEYAQTADWDECVADEYLALKALAEAGDNITSEWAYGTGLIRDSYFEQYAYDLADDLGLLQKGSNWPYNCIDWEQAARELQADYTSLEWGGVTYWVRS